MPPGIPSGRLPHTIGGPPAYEPGAQVQAPTRATHREEQMVGYSSSFNGCGAAIGA